RILTHISWPSSVREEFFSKSGRELPKVEYPAFDPTEAQERIVLAKSSFRFEPFINDWLHLIAYNIETSARMLGARGTPDFFRFSAELYGLPTDGLSDQENSVLGLAQEVDTKFNDFKRLNLPGHVREIVSADDLAIEMAIEVEKIFGDQAPQIQVVDELSANALAGPKRIRIRRGARFTPLDVRQLIHHEAHIHVSTFLNGHNQEFMRILGASHPGVTKTQEGLAVFAEFITGSMDLDRFRRLADRVIAIQMAIEGADFLQVYRFFLERTDDPEQSFESARRVFRGGVLEGGAPFTKDIVYLDGLIRVHNFLRTMVDQGRADCVRLLFCGKLDLEDLPVIGHFAEKGICQPPKFLPAWAKDLKFLLCYLTYSSFLNKIDLVQVKNHYARMLDRIPIQNYS
ncbi:MAG: flavohemoglobin expression-modulating QEGLA motif protein, partial [Planctomycetota bacterium]